MQLSFDNLENKVSFVFVFIYSQHIQTIDMVNTYVGTLKASLTLISLYSKKNELRKKSSHKRSIYTLCPVEKFKFEKKFLKVKDYDQLSQEPLHQ